MIRVHGIPDAPSGQCARVGPWRSVRSGRVSPPRAAWLPLHPSASDRAAHPTGPRADSPAPSTVTLSTVDSPVADPAPLPNRPLARAAFLYARCNPMNVENENCRFRLVLTDGSQYTLPKSVTHEGPVRSLRTAPSCCCTTSPTGWSCVIWTAEPRAR